MEAEFVQWLRQRLPTPARLLLGIGDDAAVLSLRNPDGCVVTTDLLCDGVHFRLESTRPQQIGRKALAVNLSDLAAMASVPEAAFISLLLPRAAEPSLAQQVYEGLIALAEAYQVTIAGGDTNTWEGPLVINVTLLGSLSARGPLRRGGAQVGDAILVTGQLGGSLSGHHLTFQPRVREALLLHANYDLHAGMDISDGLALDLSRLLQESGAGAVIETPRIPIAPAAQAMSRSSGRSPLQHALSDGEDFELLITSSAAEADRLLHDQPLSIPITRIGTVVARRGQWQVDAQGHQTPLPASGYLH